MARSIRIEYAGAFYHVMARGNRRESIFEDDEDRAVLLSTLAQACERTGWRVHAWVLMSNHYHFCVQTPEPNLVAGMTWLQNTYTRRFNTRHQAWGRLFGDRYKAVLVEGGSAGRGYYYETLLDYIHLNPARAGLVDVRAGQSLLDYPWSSVAAGYALAPRRRAGWLADEAGLSAFGCADTVGGRRRFVARLDQRARQEVGEGCGVAVAPQAADGRRSHLRDGWYWGSQAFSEGVLQVGAATLVKKRDRGYKASQESRAHGESAARELLARSLKERGLSLAALGDLAGSDRRKVQVALLIKEQTTMSMGWIAEALRMRSAANASQQIRRYQTDGGKKTKRANKTKDRT